MSDAGPSAPAGASVFVLGSVNRDFVLKVARRPGPGETVTDATLERHNGGKGANQAVAAARAGASVALLACVGEDAIGEEPVRSVGRAGVDVSLVKRVSGVTSGAAFITVTPDGENAITVAPGANRHLFPEDVDAVRERLSDAGVVVAQMEIPPETVARAGLLARESGARFVLNFAPPRPEAPRSVVRAADPLVVNEHEAAFLLGGDRPVRGARDALGAARDLLRLGPNSAVITLGPEGAVFAEARGSNGSSGASGHLPAPPVEPVDTTGAGDTFVGTLAAHLARGASLEEAVEAAVRAGSEAVTREGARG